MQKSEVFALTDEAGLVKAYEALSADGRYHDMDHPLFVKGIFAGMEILAEAVAQSISQRKLLESDAPQG